MIQSEIILHKVAKQFDHEQQLFSDISLCFRQGISYAIQGVSGTGKSTLLSLIANLDTPSSGTISFIHEKKNCFSKELSKADGSIVGFLFQQPYLIKELSIIENIYLPGIIAGQKKENCNAKGEDLLEKINLSDKAHAYPHQLSGGQLQRVALARALFNEPLFLIADEPTASLDFDGSQEIVALLQFFQKKLGMGLIIATHDDTVAAMLDERYVLHKQTLFKQ